MANGNGDDKKKFDDKITGKLAEFSKKITKKGKEIAKRKISEIKKRRAEEREIKEEIRKAAYDAARQARIDIAKARAQERVKRVSAEPSPIRRGFQTAKATVKAIAPGIKAGTKAFGAGVGQPSKKKMFDPFATGLSAGPKGHGGYNPVTGTFRPAPMTKTIIKKVKAKPKRKKRKGKAKKKGKKKR